MKVTSAIFETMSGKLGGAVASKARGGVKYLRALVIPSNPQSSDQTAVRAILTGLAGAWKSTLTDSQRAAWSALAADQESGIDVYCGNNLTVMQAGHARVDAAPASRSLAWTSIPDLSTWTLLIDGPDFAFNSPAAATTYLPATTSRLSVYLETGIQIPSRLRRQFPYRFGAKQVTPSSGNYALSIVGSRFPELAGVTEGDQVWARVVGSNDAGQVTGTIAALFTLASA